MCRGKAGTGAKRAGFVPERGEGQGWWSLVLTTRGMGPSEDSRTLEVVVISQFLTRDLSQDDGCASRGLKA